MITAGGAAFEVSGGPGDDTIRAGAGADRVDGGPGRDAIATGAGDDTVAVRDGRRDRIRAGSGRDTVVADRFDELVGCESVLHDATGTRFRPAGGAPTRGGGWSRCGVPGWRSPTEIVTRRPAASVHRRRDSPRAFCRGSFFWA